MPTLRDVARLAGVSTATVSNVINNSKYVADETRRRVERAVSQTGFVPNHSARLLSRTMRRPSSRIRERRPEVSGKT